MKMIKIILKFKDDNQIEVILPDYIAYEWRNDKKLNSNLNKLDGAKIISFEENFNT